LLFTRSYFRPTFQCSFVANNATDAEKISGFPEGRLIFIGCLTTKVGQTRDGTNMKGSPELQHLRGSRSTAVVWGYMREIRVLLAIQGIRGPSVGCFGKMPQTELLGSRYPSPSSHETALSWFGFLSAKA
jgi:hypothetical protein